jgi:PPM family protein phosphatase
MSTLISLANSQKGPLAVNEDAFFSLPEAGLFGIADGLSVKRGGEVASRLAVGAAEHWALERKTKFHDLARSGTKEDLQKIESALEQLFQDISRIVYQEGAKEPNHQGMCTTLDLLLVIGSQALIGHVGSGRIYLIRKGQAHQLTEDHTLLAQWKRLGKTEEHSAQEQSTAAWRLTRAVGFREEVKVDLLRVELEPGDRFVLLTDGAWHPLPMEELELLLGTAGSREQLADSLTKGFAAKEVRDNYTWLILDPPLEGGASAEAGAEAKVRLLGKVPVFEYLSYQDLLKVMAIGELVKVGKGHLLCKEGDPGGEMMLILQGEVSVAKNQQTIRKLVKGDVFGEMSMLDAAPRSASITSASPTNLIAFPREAMFELFREDPELAVKVLWGVSQQMNHRLRKLTNQIAGLPELEGIPAHHVSGQLPFQWAKRRLNG